MAATACHPRIHEETQIIETVGGFFFSRRECWVIKLSGRSEGERTFQEFRGQFKGATRRLCRGSAGIRWNIK